MKRQRPAVSTPRGPVPALHRMSSTPHIARRLFVLVLVLVAITAAPVSSTRKLHLHQPAAAPTPTPSTTAAANSTDDLISAACRRAQYPDVCNSTLRSNPASHGATDLKGLADISLDVAIAHARETLALAKRLAHGAAYNDTYASGCLRDCLDQYDDAIADLGDSKGALRQGLYDTVNSQVSGAMTDAQTCEDGFADRPGYTSPLTDRNGYFHKLCSNSLAITSLIAV